MVSRKMQKIVLYLTRLLLTSLACAYKLFCQAANTNRCPPFSVLRGSLLLVLSVLPFAATWAQSGDEFQTRTFTDAQGHVLPYRLFVPKDYNANQKYPLVLLFHGAGERGTNNTQQVVNGSALVFAKPENQSKWPSFVLVPQCPPDQQWVDMPWGATSGTQPAKPTWPLAASMQVLAELQQEFAGIDPSRLLVTGYSMGGYATWDVITRYPDVFQKAAPVCGGGDTTQVGNILNKPIWAFHSADDEVVPVVRSRSMIRTIKRLGGSPLYTEYCSDGLYCWGHSAWFGAYYNEPRLLPWLFEQPVVELFAEGPTIVTSGNSVILRAVPHQQSLTTFQYYRDGEPVTPATSSRQYQATETGSYTVKALETDGDSAITSNELFVTVSTPMPVELTSFTAHYKGREVQLNWITASEKNSVAFIVESSADGRSFQRLGQVAGQGTKLSRTAYSFTDAQPGRYGTPTAYYRLQQVDQDGSLNYSPIVVVTAINPEATLVLEAYPVPFDEALTLLLSATNAGPLTTTLYDALGHVMHCQTTQVPAGKSQVSVPELGRLLPGVYCIRVQQGTLTRTSRVMHQ